MKIKIDVVKVEGNMKGKIEVLKMVEVVVAEGEVVEGEVVKVKKL